MEIIMVGGGVDMVGKNSIIIFLIENFKKIIKKIELNIAYYFKVYVKRIIKYECLSIL